MKPCNTNSLFSEMSEEARSRTFSKPDAVRRLLARAVNEGLSLDVQIEAFTLRFHSRFSAQTDLSMQHLVLEALFPSYGNELLSSNRFISVSFTTGNFMVSFRAPFDKGWKEDDSWLWKIAFPDSAALRPLRKYFRVEPAAGDPVRIYFELDDDLVLGNVVDISVGGFLFVSKVRAPILEAGKEIVGLQLKLPGRSIQVDAKVVRITSVNCAVIFTSISDDDRRALQDYTESRVAEIRRGFAV